jgi:hypothetical protein
VLSEPNPVLSATDALGRPIDLAPGEAPKQAVSPGAAFLVTDILSDNVARKPMFGENSPLKLSRPAAAKTGTTTDFRDNWTIGFTRYLTTGVWAGNSDGHPMKNTSGLTGAAPIWHDFMEAVIASPRLVELLGAPNDPSNPEAGWEFTPPDEVELWPDCPPGVDCRAGGEYYTRAWLDAAGELGPLADSVENVPSAPVYADRGGGLAWAAYCQVEPAATRALLRLPGELGLPTAGDEAEVSNASPGRTEPEALHVIAWSLRHPSPINLGPCEQVSRVAPSALALDRNLGPGVSQVVVDLSAALDPNAGGVAATDSAVAFSGAVDGGNRYRLAQAIAHHSSCPGNYLLGQVLNWQGGPVAGVRVTIVDQWGNSAETLSKSGAADYGLFDFPLNYFANQYTLTVMDELGKPISAPIVVDHLQGSAGDAPCHTVVLQGS